MRYIEKRIKNGELKLIPIGDIHLGDPTSDLKLLEGTLDYVKHSKNCFILGMGDYLNCATKSSVSDLYISKLNPQEEYERIIELFEPVRDRILGLIIGNHEQRIQKESGVNLVKAMSKELGVPYLGWSAFLRFKVNEQNYVAFATHGSTTATTLEGKIRSLRKIMDSFIADVFLMGHVHELQLPFVDEVYYVDLRNKGIRKRKRYGLFTGHFLDYSNSYAEMKALRPAKRGVPKIKFFGDRWDIHVSV